MIALNLLNGHIQRKFVPANKNLWDQIMKSCEEGNFEIDEYSYKIE